MKEKEEAACSGGGGEGIDISTTATHETLDCFILDYIT